MHGHLEKWPCCCKSHTLEENRVQKRARTRVQKRAKTRVQKRPPSQLAGNVGRMSADVGGGQKTHMGTHVGRMSAVLSQARSCSSKHTLQAPNVGGMSAGADVNVAHFQGLQRFHSRARINGSSKILRAPSQASRPAVTMDAAATQTCFLCGEDYSQDAAGRSWARKFECRRVKHTAALPGHVKLQNMFLQTHDPLSECLQ